MVISNTDILSFIKMIKLICIFLGVCCAIWHASTYKVCERPLNVYDKKTLKKPLYIGGIAGLIVFACISVNAYLIGKTFWGFIISIGIFKILFMPSVYALVYYWPSKRRKELKRRQKFRKAST
ncbi:MAG: hypothetical protein KBC11_03075 [Candidatus Pacebacteria bacterium]|nr:hypothetical protein [Candidatus Paceibacterota bacterium]